MLWGRMKAGCLCAVWSSAAGLTRFSLDESCAVGDDEGERGEKCCFWCDEWDVDDVDSDVLSALSLYLNKGMTVVESLNVTFFFGFGLGSWKESTLLLLLRFFFFAWGWSWNDELSWHIGFKWAWFLLYCFPFRPSMMYEHPHSNISLTVPVNHLTSCCTVYLERTILVLSLWGLICPWLCELDQNVPFECSVFQVVMGVFSVCWWVCGDGHDSTLCGPSMQISAGDGKSDASGVSHSCSSARAWAFGDPSVFL